MENITQKMTMEEVQATYQRFGIADYIVFATMLLGCSGIGLYYALAGKKNKEKTDEADEYLLGGRNMKVFPISLSLVASFISGITLLGTPTEMYLHGTEYMFVLFGMVASGLISSYLVLPVFHELRLSSTYEYLRIRFDKRVQLFGSVLFTIGLICWLPIVIYVPALAFNQVTGVNVHIITPLVCLVCIFYTCIGGLKAVVWTDVVQTFLMIGAIFIIIIKGTYDVGAKEVWQRNWDSGRLEIPSFEPDLTIRHSALAVTFGLTIHFLQNGVVNQNMIQRYLCLPTLKDVRIALWIFVFGCSLFIIICGYAGLLAYATYHDCDPLTTGLAKEKDQLLPLLVMRVLSHMPGMPGMFVAGVFSAALSSLSTGLNSMSAVVLEDFIKPNIKKPLSETATHYILRAVVVIFGIICVSLVFIVEKLGSVLQLSMSLSAVTCGASFGILVGGTLLPWINAKGALWGGVSGLIVSSVLVVGYQHAIAIGALVYSNKPSSIEGCDYLYPITFTNATSFDTSLPTETQSFFKISYLFHTLFGGLFTSIASLLISFATGGNDYTKMDIRFFSPVIRPWLISKRKQVREEKSLLNSTTKNQIIGRKMTNGNSEV